MKKNASRDGISNRILLRLTPKDFGLLRPDLSPVELPLRKSLEAPNTPIEHVYFIESGFASVVADGRGESIEVGLVGREGMTGLAVVMGATSSPNATFIQCEGRGLRILASSLTRATERSPALQRVVLQYAHTFAVQSAQTALSNGRSKLSELNPAGFPGGSISLEGWSYGQAKNPTDVFPGGARARRPHGVRTRPRAFLAMGGYWLNRGEDRLHGADAA